MSFAKVLAVVPAILSLAGAAPHRHHRAESTDSCAIHRFTENDHHEQIIDNYINLWQGNFSLLDQVLSSNVSLYQDRLPLLGQLEIHNSSDFLGWIKHSHGGRSEHNFKKYYWVGEGYTVMLRWQLHGVNANATHHYPTGTVPVGTAIEFNGTDSYLLNPCTGLMDEVDSAQDFIDYFHQLTAGTISVAN